jgi:hypothetical protein
MSKFNIEDTLVGKILDYFEEHKMQYVLDALQTIMTPLEESGPTGVQTWPAPGITYLSDLRTTGPFGPTGMTGPFGSGGPTGESGPYGATGITGVKGPRGETGFAGHTGATGSVGSTGPAGVAGAPDTFSSFVNTSSGDRVYYDTVLGVVIPPTLPTIEGTHNYNLTTVYAVGPGNVQYMLPSRADILAIPGILNTRFRIVLRVVYSTAGIWSVNTLSIQNPTMEFFNDYDGGANLRSFSGEMDTVGSIAALRDLGIEYAFFYKVYGTSIATANILLDAQVASNNVVTNIAYGINGAGNVARNSITSLQLTDVGIYITNNRVWFLEDDTTKRMSTDPATVAYFKQIHGVDMEILPGVAIPGETVYSWNGASWDSHAGTGVEPVVHTVVIHSGPTRSSIISVQDAWLEDTAKYGWLLRNDRGGDTGRKRIAYYLADDLIDWETGANFDCLAFKFIFTGVPEDLYVHDTANDFTLEVNTVHDIFENLYILV